ncbi:MAG TPA: Uma2 family endonuclease, partial [Deltaproteobacteria bacterium]|nr:Uma2 family endonuclease [Deltaproteobacteria bacterium]
MAEEAKKKAAYDDLYSIPENMTGQIIDGELIVTPRPSRYHVYA